MTWSKMELVQRFLGFYSHSTRDAGSSIAYRGLNTGLDKKVVIERPNYAHDDKFWLSGYQVEEGMKAAINESNNSSQSGQDKKQSVMMHQLTWVDPEYYDTRFYTRASVSLKNQLEKNIISGTRKFFWSVNKESCNPTNAFSSGGIHWIVIVLELPCSIDDQTGIRNRDNKIYVRKFDPFGTKLSENMVKFLDKVLSDIDLVGIFRKKCKCEIEEVNVDISQLSETNVSMQRDGYQCGVWCVWFTHVFSSVETYDDVFKNENKPQTGIDIRKLYFNIGEQSSTSNVSRKRPCASLFDDTAENLIDIRPGATKNNPLELE